MAWMNGVYAIGLAARREGTYSPFVWWLAVTASAIQLILFLGLELSARKDARIGVLDAISLIIAVKLVFGQLAFLLRRKRELTDERFTSKGRSISPLRDFP